MDLFYINGEYGSVFDSQVLALLESMNSLPGISKVVLLCGYRNNHEKVEIKNRIKEKSFEVRYFRIFPNYPLFNSLNRISIANGLKKCLFNKTPIVHIRGELLAMLSFYPLRKSGIPVSNILVDVRGVRMEEISQYYSHFDFLKKYKNRNSSSSQKFLIRFSNINAVSARLRDYIHQNAEIAFEKIDVVHCLSGSSFVYNDLKRDKIRNKLGLKSEDCLFVFSSGTTDLWQKNEEILIIAEKGYKVLNLSHRKISHPNIINSFLAYNDVPDYLFAADIAVLIRDQSTVNLVASPVKFSEYICSGLPVISNGTVDMVADYIKSTGHGLILRELKDINHDDVIRLRCIRRDKISQTGLSNFSVDKISKDYYSIYQRMLNSR